jgi:iron complex transport system substrate-binding protein
VRLSDQRARTPEAHRRRHPAEAAGAEIDALVSEQPESLYTLDEEMLQALRPDLILTQEQCDVRAVNELTVRRAAARLPGPPRVESVAPRTLDDVFAMFRRVGELIDRPVEAEYLVAGFHRTVRWIYDFITPTRPKPRVVLLEWLDPPFCSGHWNPEIIRLAGGREMIGRAGEQSRRITWDEIAAAEPEVILVALRGFELDRAERELAAVVDRPEWRALTAVRDGRVALADGSAFFSRPGPRLEVGLRIAAGAMAPNLFGSRDTRRGEAWRFPPPP